MSFFNYISENILLPIGDIVTRQSVYKHFHFLNYSQDWTREQINSYQIARLKQLLLHSMSHVPYYRELFSILGLQPGEIQKLEDLTKIPITYKSNYTKKKELKCLLPQQVSKRDLIQNSSSGSTGEPLFYYSTKDAYSMNLAASLRGWYWMGYQVRR